MRISHVGPRPMFSIVIRIVMFLPHSLTPPHHVIYPYPHQPRHFSHPPYHTLPRFPLRRPTPLTSPPRVHVMLHPPNRPANRLRGPRHHHPTRAPICDARRLHDNRRPPVSVSVG